MSGVRTYAVNCNDAWLNTDGDDISGSYVKYADYIALATKLDLAGRACEALTAENAWMKEYLVVEVAPATDAFLAEVRAQGVEMAISQALMDGIPVNRMQFISRMTDFAAQLRKGGEQK